MDADPRQRIKALDEQIQKIREMHRRWADGQDLSQEELVRRELTLELLDGATEDLLKRRAELEKE